MSYFVKLLFERTSWANNKTDCIAGIRKALTRYTLFVSNNDLKMSITDTNRYLFFATRKADKQYYFIIANQHIIKYKMRESK